MQAGTPSALATFAVATTLATLAAAVAPGLFGRASRAVRVIVSIVTWNALVVVPVYVLGLLDALYRGPLALFVGGVSATLLVYAALRLGSAGARREIGATLRALVLGPFEALSEARRAGSFAVVSLLTAMVLFAWATAQAVLAPMWGDWDCLWYHEPIIAFTVQNHGFATVPLEPFTQKVNGYPRLSEMTMFWFGFYHGRWAIDLVNPIMLVLVGASTFTITRALGADRPQAIGWASVAVTLPGLVRLVPTCMVDLHSTALTLAAFALACRRQVALRELVFAALAVALAIGTKTLVLVPGGMICLVILARMIEGRAAFGRRRTFFAALLGASFVVAILSATFLRNYVLYHNPIWPDFHVVVPELGIDWPGNYSGMEDPILPPADRIESTLEAQLRRLYAPPFSVNEGHSWQIIDYGLGMPYAFLPLAVVLGPFLLLEVFLFGAFARFRGGAEGIARRSVARRALAVALPSMLLLPAFHIARYHTVSLILAMGLLAYFGARFDFARLAEATFAVYLVGNVATLALNDRMWLRPPSVIAEMIATPVPQRHHDPRFRSPERLESALARERELGPGDLIVFERIAYLSLLFNDHYSNRVRWLEEVRDPRLRARQWRAKWIYTVTRSWWENEANLPTSGWERIGYLETESQGAVYRRKGAR